MNKIIILNIAKQYLIDKNINFIEPGRLGRLQCNMQEVIFLDSQILDSNVAVIEPIDIRVWVNIKTQQVLLEEQM